MRYFKFKTIEQIKAEVDYLGLGEFIKFDEKLEAIFKPIRIGKLTIGNRFAIHPMEGCDGTLDGKPDELTFRRWKRFGASGVKLIWGEATAVVEEGFERVRKACSNNKKSA
jgi:2,4-dienoyl-CoA reductase-like NADH-dependent reductase (Old Yellow Enzyme family)